MWDAISDCFMLYAIFADTYRIYQFHYLHISYTQNTYMATAFFLVLRSQIIEMATENDIAQHLFVLYLI